jgi:hypothetical protein
VIDAMLFVFGKRAKQLRLNKVSELIHNSTYHQNLEMARVSVHFQEIVDLVSSAGGEGRWARRAGLGWAGESWELMIEAFQMELLPYSRGLRIHKPCS